MSDEDKLCAACAAYLKHYPIMSDEWQCNHDLNEQAFMLAMADAVHGPEPEGEFAEAGWRAAMFLDDAELAFDCGPSPYKIQVVHNVGEWSFMGLVNGRHLIGVRGDEGAESEYIADIDWVASRV